MAALAASLDEAFRSSQVNGASGLSIAFTAP
jgi:hypothetical protein